MASRRHLIGCSSGLDGNQDQPHGGHYSQDESPANTHRRQILCSSLRSGSSQPWNRLCGCKRSAQSTQSVATCEHPTNQRLVIPQCISARTTEILEYLLWCLHDHPTLLGICIRLRLLTSSQTYCIPQGLISHDYNSMVRLDGRGQHCQVRYCSILTF